MGEFNFSLFKDLSNFEFVGVKVPLVILVWIDKTVSRGSTLRICQGLFKPLFIQKEFDLKKKKKLSQEVNLK